MSFFQVLKDSFKRIFTSPYKLLGLGFIIIVAALFGILTPTAFNIMPDSMEDFPIAIVNEDAGTIQDGKHVNYGDDIMDTVADNDDVNWEVQEPGYFDEGINNTKYFAAFVIPKDFSKRVVSAKDGVPEKADIVFLSDIRKSYIFSQFSKSIKTQFIDMVSQNVSEEYVSGAFDSIYEIKDELTEAADGSQQVTDGAGKLKSGADTLKSGTNKVNKGAEDLAAGSSELNDGAGTLKKGTKDLNDGAQQLAAGSTELAKGSNKLAAGADQLNQVVLGINVPAVELTEEQKKEIQQKAAQGVLVKDPDTNMSAVDLLAAGVGTGVSAAVQKGIKDGIGTAQDQALANEQVQALIAMAESAGFPEGQGEQLIKGIVAQTLNGAASQVDAKTISGTLANDKTFVGGVQQIAGGAAVAGGEGVVTVVNEELGKSLSSLGDLKKGTQNLADGAAELDSNMGTFSDGAKSVANGSAKVAAGSVQLAAGTAQLVAGSEKLADGTSQLSKGAGKLAKGASDLKDGSGQLTDGLTEGVEKIDDSLVNSSEAMGEFVADPVVDKVEIYGELTRYSQGFFPLFLGIGLWVGTLLLFFVVPVRPRRDELVNAPKTVASGILTALLFGLMEVALIFAGVNVLGLNPAHPMWLLLFLCFVSLAFITIIYMLCVTFGLAGKLIAVMFTVFQIPCCAGSFPVQLMPEFFQKLNPFLPMTYAIDGVREALSGTEISGMYHNCAMLCIFMAISLMIALLTCKRTKERTEMIEAAIAE
ncbi:MAG: YhgE/Pip domain-containing protein [Eubacterium sp.]|nr:YhgE/Pip domain-containing protein [Candidatus Colimonas fimequi]